MSMIYKETTPKRVLAKKYYGIWGDDGMSDDEFVKELKSLRSFSSFSRHSSRKLDK